MPVSRVLRLVVLLALGTGVGCASHSPFNQTFVEVVTPNFHVTSSLGDEATRTLALDLEVFHAGALFALGIDADTPTRTRTRVLAFDGRSATRPFAVRGAASFLVPTIDGPTLVIRATGSFSERVEPDTRHAYAHRVLRDQVPTLLPLWYEEGRAQVASTVAVNRDQAEVGRIIPAHRERILDWRKGGLAEIVQVRQVARRSPASRRDFEAQAWGLAHTLLFSKDSRRGGMPDLDRLARAFAGAEAWQMPAVTDVLRTSEEALTARVYAHLENEKFRGSRMRIDGLDPDALELSPVGVAEARTRMAELALELGRPGLAEEYFDRALSASADSGSARAGRALARARQNDFGELDALASGAREAGGRDAARRERWLGWAYLAQAEHVAASTGEAGRRDVALDAARRAFRQSLEVEGRTQHEAEAWVGLALCEVVAGTGGEAAYRLLEKARAQQPGALRIRLASARIAASLGRQSAASSEAGEVISRSHWLDLEREAEPFSQD